MSRIWRVIKRMERKSVKSATKEMAKDTSKSYEEVGGIYAPATKSCK